MEAHEDRRNHRTFPAIRIDSNEYEGVECWSARELAKLLGYAQWRNFENIVNKAKAHVNMQNKRFHTILLKSAKWFPSVPVRNAKFPIICSPAMPVTSSPKTVTRENRKWHLPKIISPCRRDEPTGTTTYPRLRTDTSAHQTCRNRKTPVRHPL